MLRAPSCFSGTFVRPGAAQRAYGHAGASGVCWGRVGAFETEGLEYEAC
jgi:hypothetical protein